MVFVRYSDRHSPLSHCTNLTEFSFFLPGLTAVALHRMVRVADEPEMRDADSGSPKPSMLDRMEHSMLFPTSLLALGGLQGLHPSLVPAWFPHPSSPPPTPGEPRRPEVTSSTNGRRPKRRVKTLKVETIPEPPLSPPTSGSSPQSNGSVGDKDKLFTCGICKRSFGYKHVLQNHERTHTGEKPFECPECHKRFTRDHHLKTHMRLHTGEKPYHCKHCDRSFVQVANLRRHLRVHTGEKPYACELCSSKFSDSNQLKAHMLIHNGQKPFHCPACGGSFRRRHHMVHHKCQARTTDVEVDSDSDTSLTINNNNNRRKPKDIRRVVRPAPPVITSPTVLPPEQTEPEDLSLPKSKLREHLTQESASYHNFNKYRHMLEST